MNYVKEEFIRLFKLSGWKQTECASKLSMSPQAINGIVKGKANPSRVALQMLKSALMKENPDLKIEWLIPKNVDVHGELIDPEGDGEESENDTYSESEDRYEKELLSELRKFEPKRKRFILMAILDLIKNVKEGKND